MQDLIGHSFGRYHILEKLGEGGMAVVYKAFDTRLETEVAIKIIRTEKITSEAAPTVLKRFENEARKTAQLTHPNIVPVIDYGEYQGTPFLVMKYIPGGTLKKFTGKPMPYKDAIELVLPILEALDYAHKNGLVHRDVKPGNILVTESGEPLLSDFGIAKVLDVGDETLDHLTVTGVGIGTPEYMSPEQAKGRNVDARSDIYAMGVVLYELVTGRRPFIADTPLAVIIKQTTDPLPSPRSFVPGISEAMERILYKALAKNPDHRFESTREFIHWLKKVDSPEVREIQIPIEKELESSVAAFPRRRWLWALIPLVLVVGAVLFFLKNGVPSQTAEPTKTQLPALEIDKLTVTMMPTGTSIATATPANTATPAPDYSYMAANPHLGPAPEGAFVRIGKGTITDTDITPDSRFLIVATNFGLYVYETETLELVKYIPVDEEPNQVEVDPDGTGYVTTDYNGNLIIWDLPTFEVKETLKIAKQGVKDIEFTHDGSRLILACLDQAIRILDMDTGEIINTILLESGVPVSVDVHPSDEVAAVSFEDFTFRIFEIKSGNEVTSVERPAEFASSFLFNQDLTTDDYVWLDINRVRYSENGSQLYFSDSSTYRVVYNTPNYEKVFTFQKTTDFSESSDLTRSATIKETSLIITELDTGDNKVYPPVYGGASFLNDQTHREIYFSPDSTWLIQVETFYVKIYDIENDYDPHTLLGYEVFDYVDYLNTTNQLITRSMLNPSGANPPTIWDDNIEPIISFENPIIKEYDVGNWEEAQFFVQSPDGSLTAGTLDEPATQGSRFLYLWDSKTGEFIKRLPSISSSNMSLSFSWDNENIAVGMSDGSVQIISIMSGAFTHTINTDQGSARVLYSPDDEALVTIGTDRTLKVWETENYSLVTTIKRTAGINCLDFILDGKMMITGDAEGNILTWDTSTWEIADQMEVSENGIGDIKTSHDQEKFALISGDTIQIWDFSRVEKIQEILVSGPLGPLSFSGDDRFLLSHYYYLINTESHIWIGNKAMRSSAIIWQLDT